MPLERKIDTQGSVIEDQSVAWKARDGSQFCEGTYRETLVQTNRYHLRTELTAQGVIEPMRRGVSIEDIVLAGRIVVDPSNQPQVVR